MSKNDHSAPGNAWTTPADLKARLIRDWNLGRLGAAVLDRAYPTAPGHPTARGHPAPPDSPDAPSGASTQSLELPGLIFPLRIPLRTPVSRQLSECFEEARNWIAALKAGASSPGYRLEMQEVAHRQLGKNQVPVAALFERPEDALSFVGKQKEGHRLLALTTRIRQDFPVLAAWCRQRPLVVLEHEADWPTLLACLAWFVHNPQSGRYVRQIDAPGVHSKFVETHRALLTEILDLVLPGNAIDHTATGVVNFARRYGLRDKPIMIRLRILDSDLTRCCGFPSSLMALPADDFARLFYWPPQSQEAQESSPATNTRPLSSTTQVLPTRVFITENEINFLAFPEIPGSVVIFGAGFGFEQLARATWLQHCPLHYWGDLDTHGFAILNQLRASFPQVRSLLMDRETLLAHRELWTLEPQPTSNQLSRLDEAEQSLYGELVENTHGTSVRLEQERLAFAWVETAIRKVLIDGLA